MNDRPYMCGLCDGEGGHYTIDAYPAKWAFCSACFGLGWRSLAADRYFGRARVPEIYPSPLER